MQAEQHWECRSKGHAQTSELGALRDLVVLVVEYPAVEPGRLSVMDTDDGAEREREPAHHCYIYR